MGGTTAGKSRGSDDDLMQRAAQGDGAAFCELVGRHREWVCRLMHAIVRDPHQAEDLAQEVFCRVYRRMGDYLAAGSFVPYLKLLAVNLAKDHLRGRRRQAPVVPLDTLLEARSEDPRIDPAAALASRALRDEIREALRALPEDPRQAILLHYFGERSVEEIASTLSCPPGTVKSRLFHGRRRIREMLADRHHPKGSEGDDRRP